MLKLFRSFYYHAQAADDDDASAKHIAWFLGTFAIVLTLLALAAFVMAISTVGPLKVNAATISLNVLLLLLGVYLLIGSAGFAGGAMLGFLFGIPRVRAATTTQATGEVDSNTNLEQVSDWLTKIVVGVSLVQLHKINTSLVDFSDQVNLAFHPAVPGVGFAACLILVGSGIAGFLAAYLKSKTDLIAAFASVLQRVRSAVGTVAQEAIESAARTILDTPGKEPDQALKDAAAKLIQVVPAENRDPDLLKLAGFGQALLKNFKAAADCFNQSSELSGDPDTRTLAARAFALAGKPIEAQGLSEIDLPPVPKPLSSDEIERALGAMFAALYNPRQGYIRAIHIGERLVQDDEAKKSSRLWTYLASAYGQQHAAMTVAPPASDAPGEVRTEYEANLKESRDNALRSVQQALQLDRQRNLPLLKSLWDPNYPGKSRDEDDLESFFSDDDFKALFVEAGAPVEPARAEG